MSMLAERKRKQTWSLNPRGKAWSDDVNKFGQKMLEKMGWQQGKGLGANENGITEHVKVSHKNDTQGMGFKESNEQWTEHESNFSALLETLSGKQKNPDEDIKINSLEEKSQTSRARVHYHKFTRGKDLSRYSEKDLANIFGKKNLKDIKKAEPTKSEQPDDKKLEVNQTSFLFNGGSMKDYFTKKLSNCNNKNAFNIVNKDDSESEELRPGFGFGIKSDESTDESKLKNKYSFISYIDDQTIKRKADNFENNIISPKKKVKKGNETHGLSNPAFNPMTTPIKVDKHILHTIKENFEEHSEFCQDVDVNMNESDLICTIYKNSDKSKARNVEKQSEMDENEKTEFQKDNKIDINEHIENIKSFEEKHSQKNQKKKNKVEKAIMGVNNPVFESNSEIFENQTGNNNFKLKIKKSKNKKTVTDDNGEGISNPVFKDNEYEKAVEVNCNENGEIMLAIENPYEVKVKRKKKSKKDIDDNNLRLCNIDDVKTNVEYETQSEIKFKNKKKDNGKKNVENLGLNNPIFEDFGCDNLEIIEDLPYQNSYDGIVKRKKKKKTQKENHSMKDTSFSKEQIHKQSVEIEENTSEVITRKKKVKKNKMEKTENNLDTSQNLLDEINNLENSNILSTQNDQIDDDGCNLMLNVVSIPFSESVKREQMITSEQIINTKRRKSVRFSDVTQELIIPNNEEIKMMENGCEVGIDNMNFDSIQAHVDKNLETISKRLDMYQAEIENDMNEKKQTTFDDIMIGEVGNPHGENEKMHNGTKLKFKYADFESKTPMYQLNKTGAKKSYKHLIKGDIIVKFNNTNLHEIRGYAIAKRNIKTLKY